MADLAKEKLLRLLTAAAATGAMCVATPAFPDPENHPPVAFAPGATGTIHAPLTDIVRDAERLGGQFRGDVVAVSAHHAMLQVGDMIAVRYEKVNLDRGLSVGDRVTIQYDKTGSRVYEQGKEPARDRGGRDMQMERERAPSPR